jgi:hypothetical protein
VEASAGTGAVVFAWSYFAEALRGLAPSAQASYGYDRESMISLGTARFTITLRSAGYWGDVKPDGSDYPEFPALRKCT